jgi:hypothetical protein
MYIRTRKLLAENGNENVLELCALCKHQLTGIYVGLRLNDINEYSMNVKNLSKLEG